VGAFSRAGEISPRFFSASGFSGFFLCLAGNSNTYPIPSQMTAGLVAASRLLLKVMPAVTAVLLPALLADNACRPVRQESAAPPPSFVGLWGTHQARGAGLRAPGRLPPR